MALTLDHVVIAVRDLDAAARDYEALFGRRASWLGEHRAYGTRNALFRIENTYVELLALSGQKAKDARWAGELSRSLEQRGEGLYALALGTEDVDATVKGARLGGLEVQDARLGSGIDQRTYAQREWRNAMVPTKSSRGTRVFFIQHLSAPEALPVASVQTEAGVFVKRMDHVVVLSADMEASRRLWEHQIGARLALDRTFPERETRILFFRLGDITVEISGGSRQTEEGLGKPDRLWGVAWGVDDLEATCARLAEAGIETSGVRPGIKPGTRVATVKSHTHGVATLLIEHTEASFRPESRLPQGEAYDAGPERRAFTLTGLDHVVISTPDLVSTAAKWVSTLEMNVTEGMTPEGSHLKLVKLPAGNAFIELAQPTTEEHRVARSIAERGPGMFSISLRVDDLDAAVRDLRAKGVTVSDPEAGVWPGTRVARINKGSANGVSVQLLEG
jgi:catechol 2,3-dioxygenase-like lactoylglutathione lyase family enzyme